MARSEPVALLSLDDPRWSSFVARSADATPFHHPSWAQLLALTYRYRGFVVGVEDVDGSLVAGAPFIEVRSLSGRRSLVSLPFTDECHPLANDDEARGVLFAALGVACERFRTSRADVRGVVDAYGWRTGADAVIHELELETDVEEVRRRFSRSQVIRNIARAEREGIVVRRATEAEDLDAFYALHTRTRRRQGVPVQPRRFFTLLWSHLIERGHAFILLAYATEPRPVAGALFLRDRETTVYKFGASDMHSWPLRPNHLIFWTAIKEACARGDRLLDFGRTDLSNAGLRAFKSTWGARERPLRYSVLRARPGAATEGVSSRALSVAIRKGPEWLCRGAGETLYRFAGSR